MTLTEAYTLANTIRAPLQVLSLQHEMRQHHGKPRKRDGWSVVVRYPHSLPYAVSTPGELLDVRRKAAENARVRKAAAWERQALADVERLLAASRAR